MFNVSYQSKICPLPSHHGEILDKKEQYVGCPGVGNTFPETSAAPSSFHSRCPEPGAVSLHLMSLIEHCALHSTQEWMGRNCPFQHQTACRQGKWEKAGVEGEYPLNYTACRKLNLADTPMLIMCMFSPSLRAVGFTGCWAVSEW